MKAVARTLRITPKKLNLIAQLVRGKNATESVQKLKYAPKKGAKVLSKVLQSAIANAKTNFKQDEKSLFIKEITITKATTYKRWVPASRGRMHPILKRNAHMTITLGVNEDSTKPKSPAPKAEKAETVKAPAKKPAVKAKKATK